MLTEHQQKVKNLLYQALETSDVVLLDGSAGVGKTWLLMNILEELATMRGGDSLYCSAPTHNAVGILKEKIGRKFGIIFGTTHSALQMQRQIDFKTGAVTFKSKPNLKNPPLKGIRYFFIDEASMLNVDLFDTAIKHARSQGAKIIFCGDFKQLPPVGETISKVFSEEIPSVRLTEIIRQKAGSPIIDLSMNLNLIKLGEPCMNENDEGYIYSNDRDKVISTLAAVNGSRKLKYVAYTNKEVDAINRDVRAYIYGKPAKIELGESIIFSAPYKEDYVNNQEVKVNSVIVKEKSFPFLTRLGDGFEEDKKSSITLKVYCVNNKVKYRDLSTEWGKTSQLEKYEEDEIIIVHEESEQALAKTIKELQSLAKLAEIPWVEYYRFIEQFAGITYSHALTVHKSQGNTYEQVIVNIKNIDFNKNTEEKQKMLYTAITRASELIILYNT